MRIKRLFTKILRFLFSIGPLGALEIFIWESVQTFRKNVQNLEQSTNILHIISESIWNNLKKDSEIMS